MSERGFKVSCGPKTSVVTLRAPVWLHSVVVYSVVRARSWELDGEDKGGEIKELTGRRAVGRRPGSRHMIRIQWVKGGLLGVPALNGLSVTFCCPRGVASFSYTSCPWAAAL